MHMPVNRAAAPTGIRRLARAVRVVGRVVADPSEPDRPLPHRRVRTVPPPLV